MIDLVGAGVLGGLLAAGIAALFIKNYFPGYLAEKGKNLATKEDISQITDQVEAVRTQYADLIEATKARHNLRTSALEARLKAHQDAFALWRKLTAVAHSDEVGKVVLECQTFWENNCLYLEPAVRDAFMNAYSGAHTHWEFVRLGAEATLVSEQWKRVTDFPPILFQAIQLPGISELEVGRQIPRDPSARPVG